MCDALLRAIQIAGGQKQLAFDCGVSKSRICHIARGSQDMSDELAEKIERVTGVSKEELKIRSVNFNAIIADLIKQYGSQRKLGQALGVGQQRVSYYLRKRVPAHVAVKIEKACGVSRALLCPEIFT